MSAVARRKLTVTRWRPVVRHKEFKPLSAIGLGARVESGLHAEEQVIHARRDATDRLRLRIRRIGLRIQTSSRQKRLRGR